MTDLWLRTSTGKAGRARAHLTYRTMLGRRSLCGIVLSDGGWRDSCGAKKCERCLALSKEEAVGNDE